MPTEPQTFPNIADLLRRKDIWLEKRKSQHFLKRQETCHQIAELASLTRQHLVVEVGAGLGNLSVELGARAGKVFAVELDRSFEDWHVYLQASYPSLHFIYDDFLKVDLEALVKSHEGPVCGIGNLPYQVTSDILFRFVDSPVTFESLVFMVQREVAERIAAGPGNRAAGALTYKIALRYAASIELHVGPEQFLPPPKVESAVLLLRPLAKPLVTDAARRKRVYTLLDRLFQYRRKTLLNALQQGGLAGDKEAAQRALAEAGVAPIRRAETLSLVEVLALADALKEVRVAHG